MDMVSPILDVATRVWKCSASHASFITGLNKTMTSLGKKLNELKAIRDDVKLTVQLKEQQGMIQSNQVEVWLKSVEGIEATENDIRVQHEDISSNGSTCLGICTCRSSYKLGKKATRTLQEVEDLISKGDFAEVAIERPRPAPIRETEGLCEMPMGSHTLVGTESNFEKVLNGLKDNNVGIIGLYGMGGVGKTTLLKKINNVLPKSGDDAFDLAIWVVASQNATIETIQQSIMGKFDKSSSNKSVEDIGIEIYGTLKNRKYVLLLDDMWKMVDLFEKVGIPKPDQNKSKIIFTTRSKEVCSKMEAQIIIEVKCLPNEEAWSLFKEKVKEATLDDAQIQKYAKEIANECKGLPLALITVGSAMSGKDDAHEWLYALNRLKGHRAKFQNFEKVVFSSLQFSYEYLDDSTKQQCFLYCSLFPEDYCINNEELVDLWLGEGYLNKDHDVRKARNYGYSIIEDLKRACLLENPNHVKYVKMHDIVRDMALRLANKKFLVLEKIEIMRANSDIQDWNEDIEKMSLWNLYINEVKSSQRDQEVYTITRECTKLSTLFYKNSPGFILPRSFNLILKLRVIDLSDNYHKNHLPEVISKLENLEYLNISKTSIDSLPMEMIRLRKLKYLLMNDMRNMKECPSEIICGLENLLVFHMFDNPPISESVFRHLEKIKNIQEISMHLDSAEVVKIFQESKKLQSCTKDLKIGKSCEEFEWCPTNMSNLEYFKIIKSNLTRSKCSSNPTPLMVFDYLHTVRVLGCSDLIELDFLGYAPSLKVLFVTNCKSIQRILRTRNQEPVFSSLERLFLKYLPKLEYICNEPLSFPNLVETTISQCLMLKNPFNDMIPAKSKLHNIDTDEEWWSSLEWSDDSLKQHFTSLYANHRTLSEIDFSIMYDKLRRTKEAHDLVWP